MMQNSDSAYTQYKEIFRRVFLLCGPSLTKGKIVFVLIKNGTYHLPIICRTLEWGEFFTTLKEFLKFNI